MCFQDGLGSWEGPSFSPFLYFICFSESVQEKYIILGIGPFATDNIDTFPQTENTISF